MVHRQTLAIVRIDYRRQERILFDDLLQAYHSLVVEDVRYVTSAIHARFSVLSILLLLGRLILGLCIVVGLTRG